MTNLVRTYRSPQVCELAAVTYRQLDYWVRRGFVRASVQEATGSGDQRVFGFRDLLRVAVAAELVHAGMSVEAAFGACDDLLHTRPEPHPVTSYVALRMDVREIRARLLAGQPVRSASAGDER